MKKTIGTVCFITHGQQVLLAEIKYPNGNTLWNGIGGVVDRGESPEQAVCREISEETDLVVDVKDVKHATTIYLDNLELFVFTASRWSGKLITVDPSLISLRWFALENVPYHQMHTGNDEWLPKVLNGVFI